MTKIAQKFAKNRKKLLSLEGGGSSKTPHGFLGGVGQKTMSVHKGGGGGGKNVQNSVHMVYEWPHMPTFFFKDDRQNLAYVHTT